MSSSTQNNFDRDARALARGSLRQTMALSSEECDSDFHALRESEAALRRADSYQTGFSATLSNVHIPNTDAEVANNDTSDELLEVSSNHSAASADDEGNNNGGNIISDTSVEENISSSTTVPLVTLSNPTPVSLYPVTTAVKDNSGIMLTPYVPLVSKTSQVVRMESKSNSNGVTTSKGKDSTNLTRGRGNSVSGKNSNRGASRGSSSRSKTPNSAVNDHHMGDFIKLLQSNITSKDKEIGELTVQLGVLSRIKDKEIGELTVQLGVLSRKLTAALANANAATVPVPIKLEILASLDKEIASMVVQPCGLARFSFDITPTGKFIGEPNSTVTSFSISYASFMRLRGYPKFQGFESPNNEGRKLTNSVLDKLLADFRKQYKSWQPTKLGRQPFFNIILPVCVALCDKQYTINLPLRVVVGGGVLTSSEDIDDWYRESVGSSSDRIKLDMSGDTGYLALLAFHASNATGVFSGNIKRGTHEHKVIVPPSLCVNISGDLTGSQLRNTDNFWIIPETLPPGSAMPTLRNYDMICDWTLQINPVINKASVRDFYDTLKNFQLFRNNYIAPINNKRPINESSFSDSSATQNNKNVKHYSSVNPTEVNSSGSYFSSNDKLNYTSYNEVSLDSHGSHNKNKNFMYDLPQQYNHSTGFNNDINIINNNGRVIPGVQNNDAEIEALSERIRHLSSSVVQKHNGLVTMPLTINERTAFPIKTDSSLKSTPVTSEYFYNGESDAQKWEVVTSSLEYSYDLKGYQAVIAGVLVDFSQTLQEAVDIGIPMVGPLAPNRTGFGQNKNNKYNGNAYNNSAYPDISTAATTKSTKSTGPHFDPNNIGGAREILIKAVMKIVPTWVKGQQLNHIEGRLALESLLTTGFDLSNPGSKKAHQFLLDLKTLHTNPFSWSIAVAALHAKYFSESAKSTAQHKFTGNFQKLDESLEDYVRKMLILSEGPYGDKPVYIAQTIIANAVTHEHIRKLKTSFDKLKPNHWSSFQQLSLELTQTVLLEAIDEHSLTVPTEYPGYPEKGKDYSRHAVVVSSKKQLKPSPPSDSDNDVKKKKSWNKSTCDKCGMNNHSTAEHTGPASSNSGAKGGGNSKQKAACYTCGSEDHLKPDCPQNKTKPEVSANTKTKGGEDKFPGTDNGSDKGGKSKQLTLKAAPSRP